MGKYDIQNKSLDTPPSTFIALATLAAVTLKSKGVDYRVVLVADNSLGGDGILARTSVTDIKDFKGKNVAV